MIARLDEACVNSEAGQRLREQVDRAAIERGRGHDVIADAKKSRDGQVHRGRAACRADCADAVLEGGDALLENRRRRIRDAGIEMTGRFEIEKGGGVVGIFEDVRRRFVDGHGSRAVRRVWALSCVQAQRVKFGRAG